MILLTGATGLSGHYVVLELLRRGYAVRGLAREASAARLHDPGVDVAIGDLADPDSLRRACQIVHKPLAAMSDEELASRRFYSQSWRYDDRELRETLAYQSGRTWQQTLAETLAPGQ